MAQPHDSFWELEHKNRRETALLVTVFMTLFAALGCGLDFVFGNLRVIDGQLTGMQILAVAALVIGSIQSIASYYGGAALVLASVHARPLLPESTKEQTVLDVIGEMALAA